MTDDYDYSSYSSDSSSSSSYDESSDSPEPVEVKPGIELTFSTFTPSEHPIMYAYALKVEAEGIKGYPENIFVFQRSKENALGDCVDEFIQIASPLEIEEVPENAPDLLNNMPYYRTNKVELYFRCLEDLNLAKKNIGSDVQVLVETYDILNDGYDKQEKIKYE